MTEDVSCGLSQRQRRSVLTRTPSQSTPDLTKPFNADAIHENLVENSLTPKFNLQNTTFETQDDTMELPSVSRQRKLSISENGLDRRDGARASSLLERLIGGGFVCTEFKKAPSDEPPVKKQSFLARFGDLGPAAHWLTKPLPDTESEIFRQIAMDKW